MNRTSPRTEQLWHELHAELLRFVRRRVSDDAVADDLLQDIFLRVHDRIDSLKDSERLYAWVYSIARNSITDYFRKHQQTPVAFESQPATNEPDRENLNAEVAGWLAAMVDQLPDSYREAVRLAELEGAPQKQVADRLGLSVSGAKSRIQRGRQVLKDALLRCCHIELDHRGNVVDYARRNACPGCCDEEATGGSPG